MKFALALAFSFSGAPNDSWFGRDKLKHFVAAAVVQSIAYGALHRDGGSRASALWQASAVTTVASLGKEVVDWRRGAAFSTRDLVWDAGGAGTASLAIIHWPRK